MCILRVYICRGVAADLCHRHAIRGHHRTTTRLRFDDRPSEALLKGRKTHQVSTRIECPQFFIAGVDQLHYVVTTCVLTQKSPHPFSDWLACHDQRQVFSFRARLQRGENLKNTETVLVPAISAHMKNKSLIRAYGKLFKFFVSLRVFQRAVRVIQAVINLGSALSRNFRHAQNVGERRLGNAGNMSGTTCVLKSAQDHTLQSAARPRCPMASNLTKSASDGQHIVTCDNVWAMLDVLDIKRIRVITYVDD